MSELRTAWVRHVVPRGQPIHFDLEGFPHDPALLPALQPEALTLDAMLATQCLVLLGEPGLGKSDTLQQAYERIRLSVPEDECLYLDGRDQFDDADLFKAPQFTRWRDDGRSLHLFIDSLDEGPSSFTPRLLSKLRGKLPRESMHIRIACRTGELPEQLDRELPQLWPKRSNFFELLPLTRKDIELSAGTRAAAFLESVRRQAIAPLAIRPVTLQFLLRLFHEHEDLPDTRAKLYARGCRILCEESSATRSDSGKHGKLDPDRRLDIASQIAAVCILSRRPLVQRNHDLGKLADDTAQWRDLRSPADPESQRPGVGDDELRETLHQTSLFRSQGPLYLGFAHASYAAFLTAKFLKGRQIRLPDLVAQCTAHVPPGPLPAAVRDLAGWLAHDDSEVWAWLLKNDPRVLLVSDLRETSPAARSVLIDTLIEHAETQRLPLHDLAAHYRHLAHDGLADQLRPWIRDRKRHFLAREMAIEIAGASACRELRPELVDLVLTDDESKRLRGEALDALSRLGAPDTWRALLPLLTDPARSVPDAWSRHRLLRMLWPDHISHAERLTILDAAVIRNDDHLSYFIKHRLVPNERDDLVVELFDWLLGLPSAKRHGRTPKLVCTHLIEKALRHLETPAIRKALAQYLFARTSAHEDPFGYHDGSRYRSLLESSERSTKRAILHAIVEIATHHLRHDRLKSWNLVDADDLEWLFMQFLADFDPTRRARWLDLLAGAVEDPLPVGATADRLADAAEQYEEVHTALWRWLGPVPLNSNEARGMRESHARREERAHEARQREESLERDREWERGQLPRLIRRIDEATGDMEVLQELFHDIQYFGGNTGRYRVPTDLPATLAWAALPEPSRARLRSLAKIVLSGCPLPSDEQGWPERYHAPFLVHYSFLRLVHAQSPGWLETQPAERWEVWVPAIVFNTHNIDEKTHESLLKLTYRCAPDAVKWGFALLVARVQHAAQFQVAFTWIERILGDDAIAFVESKLQDDVYPVEPYAALLECLLTSSRAAAVEAILHQLLDVPLDRPELRPRACIAAEILWRHCSDFAWPRISPVFAAHPDFAIEVMHRAAARHHTISSKLWDMKSEDTLVEVYTWIAERFPENLDDDALHRLGELRNSLRCNLHARGTQSSLEALERLKTRLPGEASLTWSCGYARDSLADAIWRPLSPDQVLRLQPRPTPMTRPWTLLHLSDLHFSADEQAERWHSALAEDLKHELRVGRLDALVLSGDIVDKGRATGYIGAERFITAVCAEFQIPLERVVIVPGNHDVDRSISESVIAPTRDEQQPDFEANGKGYTITNRAAYDRRLAAFAAFFERALGRPYPLDPRDQAVLWTWPELGVDVLGLSSVGELDGIRTGNATIDDTALGRALGQLRLAPNDHFKLAVVHHPLHSPGEDRLRDRQFVDRLAVAGFSMLLHGHVHQADNALVRYDHSDKGRRIEVVGAGTFGARSHELPTGSPWQYNLLHFSTDQVRVETRRREAENTSWKPHACWTGSGGNPQAWYALNLSRDRPSEPRKGPTLRNP